MIWQFQCQQELIPAVQHNHWKQRKSRRFHWNWARAWQLANANVSRQLGARGGGRVVSFSIAYRSAIYVWREPVENVPLFPQPPSSVAHVCLPSPAVLVGVSALAEPHLMQSISRAASVHPAWGNLPPPLLSGVSAQRCLQYSRSILLLLLNRWFLPWGWGREKVADAGLAPSRAGCPASTHHHIFCHVNLCSNSLFLSVEWRLVTSVNGCCAFCAGRVSLFLTSYWVLWTLSIQFHFCLTATPDFWQDFITKRSQIFFWIAASVAIFLVLELKFFHEHQTQSNILAAASRCQASMLCCRQDLPHVGPRLHQSSVHSI